jgi:type IV secretion system protein VirD4
LRVLPTLFNRDPKADITKANQDWLASLGADFEQRGNTIDALFRERSKSVRAAQFETWPALGNGPEGHIALTVTRSLAAMAPEECAALRCVQHLNSLTSGGVDVYLRWCAALVWGDGKGQVLAVESKGLNPDDPVRDYMVRFGLTVEQVTRALLAHLTEVKNNPQSPDDVRKFFGTLLATIGPARQATPSVKPTAVAPHPLPEEKSSMASSSPFAPTGAAGSTRPGGLMGNTPGFLQSSVVPQTCFATKGPHAIYLGTFDDGSWLSFSGAGALVTIAPPGSGKSQCHVIPNLLQWKAPAVVLDVKGEIYALTSKWRAANVGPVFRFSPTDPGRSNHYNPLALVTDEPDQVWQESRFLADMFIVPSGGGGGENNFWDTSAKALVTAAIAYVCHMLPRERRNMSELLNVIHGGEPFKKMITGLRAAVDVAPMMRAGTSIAEMDPKTKSNILTTVQTSFQAWEDVPIERVTDRCDWSPLDLRNGSTGNHPTVYICLKPHEIEAYISILRVFIAQHIRLLTSTEPTERDRSKVLPILFLLDELPRLGTMPPVASAIEIGASYGLRVWMFAQSLGQLQEAYSNADGMISSCAVRVYLNPSGADGLAEKLSKELGNVTNLADGTQQPLVPASELAGPKWADKQLVLAAGTRPGRIRKMFAYENQELHSRIGALGS